MILAHPVPVLLYHRIDEKGGSGATRTEEFRKHLDILSKSGWRSLRLDEFDAILAGTRMARGKEFLLTFDDGHENLPLLEPELLKRGYTATAFIVTGWLEENHHHHLNQTNTRTLIQNGVFEVASHTHLHHPFYKEADCLDALRTDLLTSHRVLADLHEGIAPVPRQLAWPWGKTSPEMMKCARDAGFTTQFTVANVPVIENGPMQLAPRICAESFSPTKFRLVLAAFRNGILAGAAHWLRSRIR